MSTRIEYRNWTGIITEQQALISGKIYDKIFCTNNIRDRMESYNANGNLRHYTHYLKDNDDEVALVVSFTQLYNHSFSIVEHTAIGPYFLERV